MNPFVASKQSMLQAVADQVKGNSRYRFYEPENSDKEEISFEMKSFTDHQTPLSYVSHTSKLKMSDLHSQQLDDKYLMKENNVNSASPNKG